MSKKEQSKDVTMEDAPAEEAKKEVEEEPTVPITPEMAILNEMRACIQYYESGVQSKAVRLRSLSIRTISRFRSKLTPSLLKTIIEQFIPLKTAKVRRDKLFLWTSTVKEDAKMDAPDESTHSSPSSPSENGDVEMTNGIVEKEEQADSEKSSKSDGESGDKAKDKDSPEGEKKKKEDGPPTIKVKDLKKLEEARKTVTVETECLLQLIVLMFLADHEDHEKQVIECSRDLIERITDLNIRTLDLISARAYFYLSLAFSRLNRLSEIRPGLLSAYRTCCLRHDEPGQAVVANLILQNYLHYNLFSQADKFRLNSTFPEKHGGPYQHARYLYYIGRINSVQLHYTEAYQNLSQALRKAPQTTAAGFRQIATKFMVIVQLLLGEIPERAIFGVSDLKQSLHPYFKLTQSVRAGDATRFSEVMNEYSSVFQRDGTYTLIVRLRFNVIKTGLRNISLSYSRISLADISQKLSLGSVEDTEFIVAKAIHDGVINAVIDKTHGYLSSKQTSDVYSTYEPQMQFHKRIKFCMDIHNEAVKALRYPDKPSPAEEAVPVELIEDLDDALSDISQDSDPDVM